MKSIRDHQLDCYRALAIIYITCIVHVCYHIGVGNELLQSAILFEMPVIFFIAGAAQQISKHEHGFWDMLRNRSKRILIPFYIYLGCLLTAYLAMQLIVGKVGRYTFSFNSFEPVDWIKIIATGGCKQIPFYGHTWFISIYMAIVCSFPIQKKIIRKIGVTTFICLHLLLFISLEFVSVPGIINEGVRKTACYNLFFLIGYRYYRKCTIRKILIVGSPLLLITLWSFHTGTMIPMQIHKFPPDLYFICFGMTALCILGVIFRYVHIPQKPLLKIWNNSGYTIYLYNNVISFIIYTMTRNLQSEAEITSIALPTAFVTGTMIGWIDLKIKASSRSKA